MTITLELSQLVPDSFYVVTDNCADCGEELNRTCVMTGVEVRERWGRLVLSAPLNTPRCPKGCRATFSDLNMNTDMRIVPA